MSSRKITDLIPEMQPQVIAFCAKMAEAGIPFMITCTRRNQPEQQALWDQGRTKPGKIVTWTMESKHLEGKAADFAILKDGKPTWDLKVDVDKDSIPDYIEAGKIAKQCGLKWGGDYKKNKDYPHLEYAA